MESLLLSLRDPFSLIKWNWTRVSRDALPNYLMPRYSMCLHSVENRQYLMNLIEVRSDIFSNDKMSKIRLACVILPQRPVLQTWYSRASKVSKAYKATMHTKANRANKAYIARLPRHKKSLKNQVNVNYNEISTILEVMTSSWEVANKKVMCRSHFAS